MTEDWLAERMDYLWLAAEEFQATLGWPAMLRLQDRIVISHHSYVRPEPLIERRNIGMKFEDTNFAVVVDGSAISRFGYATPAIESGIIHAVRLARSATRVR